eukprot:1181532-Prorocentrum_minimum.AAC.2
MQTLRNGFENRAPVISANSHTCFVLTNSAATGMQLALPLPGIPGVVRFGRPFAFAPGKVGLLECTLYSKWKLGLS